MELGLAFVFTGFVLVLAGFALTRSGDALAESTGIGRLWIGTVVVAGATSLPELTTDIAAIRLGAPDLAVGDLFGSSMANMLILALIDLLASRRRVLQHAAFDHALAASFAIGLNALAAGLVLARLDPLGLRVGPSSVVLLAAYLAGARAIHRHIRAASTLSAVKLEEHAQPPPPIRLEAVHFGVAAVVILGAAPAFASSAQGLALASGLGDTFVGTWLVGLSTSLPELVACVAAIRLGAFDLAVGVLFGSNAFNMLLFFPLDLAQPGSLFAAIDPAHALSGIFAVVLMSLGLAAIVYRAKRRFGMLEPDSFLVLVTYCAAIWLLYLHGASR